MPERSRRHIISIALKSVHSIEHLWCSFENSKTPLFHKISVNFVILKQIQKIHTQWLRQAQPPNLLLHVGFDKLSHQIFYYTVPEPVEGTFSLLISVPEPPKYSHFSSRCLSNRRHIISIALKIRAIYRTSLMFLWELKNAIISQNLRELCDIKNL